MQFLLRILLIFALTTIFIFVGGLLVWAVANVAFDLSYVQSSGIVSITMIVLTLYEAWDKISDDLTERYRN